MKTTSWKGLRSLAALAAGVCGTAILALGCGGSSGDGGTSSGPTLALIDASGAPLTGTVPTGQSIQSSLTGLRANTQYEVFVLGPPATRIARAPDGRMVTAYLRLTSNSSGTIPETVLGYDLTDGNYTVELAEITRGRSGDISRATRASTNFNVGAASKINVFLAKNNTPVSTSTRSFNAGDNVFVRVTGLQPSSEVDLYVVRARESYPNGLSLQDVSGTEITTTPPAPRRAIDGNPDRVTANTSGEVAPTNVWSNVQAGIGNEYDVVVDVNRDGIFNAGDVVNEVRTVGFMIQEPDNRDMIDGHFVANLSVDVNRARKDRFNPNEDVYVYINPDTRMQLGGDRWVKKYVVDHRELANWTQGTPLTDVSGPNSSNYWDADTVQSGCTNEGRVLVWPANLRPGSYDIVIDVNRNDVYDKGVDILDGSNQSGGTTGFIVGDPPTPKKWTVLVYSAADNDLESYLLGDIQEMEQIGSNADVNVVVQVDRAPGHDTSNGDWQTTRRYYVTQDADTNTLGSTLITDMGEVKMSDPDNLRDFINWAKVNYPADRYALIVSDHGAGFRSRDAEKLPVKNIAWDVTDGGSLTVPQVASAIAAAGGVDLIGFDACLMAMAEVSLEIGSNANTLVASEEVIPATGWDYDVFLQALINTPTMTAQQLGSQIVTSYQALYGSTSGVTLSSVDQTQVGNLRTAINNLADTLITDPDGNGSQQAPVDSNAAGISDAFTSAQGFSVSSGFDDYRDLRDVADQISAAFSSNTSVVGACNSVITAINQAVKANFQNGRPQAYGLAIWSPNRSRYNNSINEYQPLNLATTTKWDEMLARLFGLVYRVELTWGSTPNDLDSHYWDSKNNHMYYANPTTATAWLDRDDTSSFGPENTSITTIDASGPANCTYAVYNFSGTTSTDSATVRVYRGGQPAPVASWTTSGWDNGSNRWWIVFDINKSNGAIIPRNERGSSSGRAIRGVMPPKQP